MKKSIFLYFCMFFMLLFISYPLIAAEEKKEESSIYPSALEKRFIPKLNRSVTFIGLGGVELGRDWGINQQNRKLPTEKTVKDILETAMANHISVIDTAASYQLSETRIGRYAPPDKKYTYLLITKAGEHSLLANAPECEKFLPGKIYCDQPKSAYDFSKKAIEHDVAKSLKKLHTKQLDVVLLHLNYDTAPEVLDKGEALATLKSLQRQGKIRFIGVSINGDLAKRYIESNDFDIIELEYNLLNQTNAENITLAHSKGMGVIVRGGLGTGLLTSQVANYLENKDLPYLLQIKALLKLVNNDYNKLTQLALAFLYQNKGISSVIIGVSNPQQLTQNIQLLNSFHDKDLLKKAQDLMKPFKPPQAYTENMGEYEENN